MKNQLIIILFLINIFSVKSQENNFGNWLIYLGNKELNSSLNWHHEIQHRNYNILGELEQLLVRTGLGYNVMRITIYCWDMVLLTVVTKP